MVRDESLSENPLCAGTVRQEKIFPAEHILLEVFIPPNDNSSITLADLPSKALLLGKHFTLRGVVHFREPVMGEKLGHYTAYCRRISGQWIVYDDLATQPKVAKSVTPVSPHLLFFTTN